VSGETYTDPDGVERCDECEEPVDECACVCPECGDGVQECACTDLESAPGHVMTGRSPDGRTRCSCGLTSPVLDPAAGVAWELAHHNDLNGAPPTPVDQEVTP